MPPTKTVVAADNIMRDLAKWVSESAKLRQENNLLICVDDDLHNNTLPLLKALGYDQIQVNRGMNML